MSQLIYPQGPDDFKAVVAEFQATDLYKPPILFSLGRHVETKNGTLASVRYPVVNGPGQKRRARSSASRGTRPHNACIVVRRSMNTGMAVPSAIPRTSRSRCTPVPKASVTIA